MGIVSKTVIFVFFAAEMVIVSIVRAAAVHRNHRLHHGDHLRNHLFLVAGFETCLTVGLWVGEGRFSLEAVRLVLDVPVAVIGRRRVLEEQC